MTGIRFSRFNKPVSIAPLVVFRILFGALMFFSTLRFWSKGWIETLYIAPKFHFTYMGFGWVTPLDPVLMYAVFGLVLLSALFIAIGLFYRVASVLFFLSFNYIELLDVTAYLNHYYFISLISFLMIWLPANRKYAADLFYRPSLETNLVPAWTIAIIRFQMAIVYIFAGLAKLNTDWLIHAEPMRTWLPAKTDLPVIGPLMYQAWVAYLFSWFGAAYDLFIVFFMLNRKTRPLAYVFVLVFHLSTALFFPGIGMFPYVMILCSLIFFSAKFHKRVLSFFPRYRNKIKNPSEVRFPDNPVLNVLLCAYIALQIIIPLRYILYPDHLFWTEEGYRFSWRVMLMEKSGSSFFTVNEKSSPVKIDVNNAEFLTPLQEKMMSTQPDMILKYAHYLAGVFKSRGIKEPEVRAEVYVALNGARSKLFIDSTVNLAAEPLSWKHYTWILPYQKK